MRVLHAYAQHDPSRLVVDAPLLTRSPETSWCGSTRAAFRQGELDWNGTWLRHDGGSRRRRSSLATSLGVVESVGPGAEDIEVGDEVSG